MYVHNMNSEVQKTGVGGQNSAALSSHLNFWKEKIARLGINRIWCFGIGWERGETKEKKARELRRTVARILLLGVGNYGVFFLTRVVTTTDTWFGRVWWPAWHGESEIFVYLSICLCLPCWIWHVLISVDEQRDESRGKMMSRGGWD